LETVVQKFAPRRGQTVTQTEYFGRLEYRICSELRGMRSKELRRIWCDGCAPRGFEVVEGRGRVTGLTWLVFDSPRGKKRPHDDGQWDLVLLVETGDSDPSNIDWESLMPATDVTGWLSLDFKNKIVTIDPLSAYPDLPAP
jgi:hypothetical protein